MEILSLKRKLAEAERRNLKAQKYARMAEIPEDDWDRDTLIQRIDELEKRAELPSVSELELAGPAGTRLAIKGVSGWQLVLLATSIAFALAVAGKIMGWLP